MQKPTQALIDKGWGLYETRGFIEADSLDGVFYKGNLWDGFEDDIQHVGKGMHSISIGDILINENGVANVVARNGFDKVQINI